MSQNTLHFLLHRFPYLWGKSDRHMRVIGSVPHEKCNITFFHWNNRYLIKLEAGSFEQTFKVNEYDLTSEGDLNKIINSEFIKQTIARFDDMATSLRQAMEKI